MGEVTKKTRKKIQDKTVAISIQEKTTERVDNKINSSQGGREGEKETNQP